MRRIRVNVHNIRTNAVIEKGNEENVSVINDVFLKKEMQR